VSALWLPARPLLLASGSDTRRALLQAAGIPVEVETPEVDERALQADAEAAGRSRDDIARLLAREKALAVSLRRPDRLVLAADQTLEAPGHPGRKAADRDEARRFLALLAGRAHRLHAAFALAQGGAVRCEGIASARLVMRPLSDAAIDGYLAAAAGEATGSVGGYRIEELGVHLFSEVDGEHSTVLGLPMPPLLAAFRRMGVLAW